MAKPLVHTMYSTSSVYGFWKLKLDVRNHTHSRFLARNRYIMDITWPFSFKTETNVKIIKFYFRLYWLKKTTTKQLCVHYYQNGDFINWRKEWWELLHYLVQSCLSYEPGLLDDRNRTQIFQVTLAVDNPVLGLLYNSIKILKWCTLKWQILFARNCYSSQTSTHDRGFWEVW